MGLGALHVRPNFIKIIIYSKLYISMVRISNAMVRKRAALSQGLMMRPGADNIVIRKGNKTIVSTVKKKAKFTRRMAAKLSTVPWPDLKLFDTAETQFAANSTVPQSSIIANIAIGTGEGDRIGTDVTMRQIQINLAFVNNQPTYTLAASVVLPCIYRVTLIYMPARVATLTRTTVFNGNEIEAFRNVAGAKDYVFLYDKFHSINTTQKPFMIRINKKGKWPMRFNNATPTTLAHYDYGCLVLYLQSSVTDAVYNSIYWKSRIRFTDQ
jgi:hypothetical protein